MISLLASVAAGLTLPAGASAAEAPPPNEVISRADDLGQDGL